jgi:hypothetical protein
LSFWDSVFQFSWREESLPVLVVALCLAFLLFHFIKEERRSVINTVNFFFVCLVG